MQTESELVENRGYFREIAPIRANCRRRPYYKEARADQGGGPRGPGPPLTYFFVKKIDSRERLGIFFNGGMEKFFFR